MNLYAQFYDHIENLRANPQDWFIHSGYAYECIQKINKFALMAGFELEHVLKTELSKISVQLGVIGKDKFDREITQDWYGTYYTPSLESIEFIRQKQVQLQRVTSKIRQKQRIARDKYDRAEKFCVSSQKPTKSRINRQMAFVRLGDLDRWSSRAFNCYNRYRAEFGAEFAKIEGK